jgi:hypothetical protein
MALFIFGCKKNICVPPPRPCPPATCANRARQDELDLRLLLLNLYGRRRKMVELDNPDRQGEEKGESENTSLLSKEPSSSSGVVVEDDGVGEDQ